MPQPTACISGTAAYRSEASAKRKLQVEANFVGRDVMQAFTLKLLKVALGLQKVSNNTFRLTYSKARLMGHSLQQ